MNEVMVSVCIILFISLAIVVWMLLLRTPKVFLWTGQFIIANGIVFYLFLAAPWAIISTHLRFVLPLFLVVASLFGLRRIKQGMDRHAEPPPSKKREQIIVIVLVLAILTLDATVIWSHSYSGRPIKLAFPLINGTYYNMPELGRTTASWLIPHRSPILLFVKNSSLSGNRASGFAPENLDAYNIFEELVYAPCNGKIVAAQDSMPDNKPFQVGSGYGNHLIIQKDSIFIVIGRLKNKAVYANTGDSVHTGQMLGEVGNSGVSGEPCLLLSALKIKGKDTVAMPITFKGRYIAQNNRYAN